MIKIHSFSKLSDQIKQRNVEFQSNPSPRSIQFPCTFAMCIYFAKLVCWLCQIAYFHVCLKQHMASKVPDVCL